MCVFLRTLLEKCGNSAGCVYVFWVFFFFSVLLQSISHPPSVCGNRDDYLSDSDFCFGILCLVCLGTVYYWLFSCFDVDKPTDRHSSLPLCLQLYDHVTALTDIVYVEENVVCCTSTYVCVCTCAAERWRWWEGGGGGGVSLHGTKVFPPSEQTPQQETRFEWHDHIRHQEVKVMESLWRPQSQDLVTLATRGQTVCKAVSSERSTEVWSIKRGCTAALSKSKSLWGKIKNRDEVTFG